MNFVSRTLLAAAVVLTACGTPELIDRTQPNYIKTSDLTSGTWYIQETVVDAPKTNGSSSVIGFGGELEKVRWEVQADMLVGYRSYEVVPGADPRVDHSIETVKDANGKDVKRPVSRVGHVMLQDGRPYKGNPVFAYPITSHFDRQREYNPSTGEQTNVLTENTTDRPWYEREYIRVDWKTNKIRNYSNTTGPGAEGQFLNFVTSEDQNANDEAMVTEYKNGELKYFDFTSQLIADPPSVYYEGYGNLPYCFFNTSVDCESQNVKIRTSVRRVDEARVADYEPLQYSEKLEVKFGFFRNEHYSYNKDYYYTESGRQLFAMRHNLWKAAKEFDSKGVFQRTIPVTERALRPVVYYMTANTPAYLYSSATMRDSEKAGGKKEDTIEYSWDHSFRRTIAVPRGIEVTEVPQMFYVCTSPVKDGDPEACGPTGTFPRIGDLRYNTIPYVEQNAGGLLGLGPSSMDPETGEVVHAAANIYGVGLDTWAGSSQQVMDVVTGETTLEQLVTGQDVKSYVFANLNPTDPRRPASGPATSQSGLIADPTRPLAAAAKMTGRLDTLMKTWQSNGMMPISKGNRREIVAQLLKSNPAVESELINLPEMKLAMGSISTSAGFTAKLNSDGEFYRKVARDVLMGVNPIEDARRKLKNTPNPQVGCFYEYDYSDEDYVGVAKRKLKMMTDLTAKFTGAANAACANKTSCTAAEAKTLAKGEVYNSLRREAYRSVTEHEVGHTLGLMHNFIASADALNYKDGYWDLRKETIGLNVGGRRVLGVTPANMVEAAKQNQHQIDEAMYEYEYSSIMDYGARVNSQNRGVGKYDDAALLFAYAGGGEPGWVEVFNEVRNNYDSPNITVPVDNQAKVFTIRGAQVEMPLAQAEHYTPASTFYTDKFHYSTLPFHFAEPDSSLEKMIDQGISRMKNRSFRKWSEMVPVYEKLATSLKNYELNQTSLANSETEYERAKTIVNGAGGRAVPVEVPFMFCSDYEVGANLLCNRNDQGADVYEMTSKWTERFEQSYVFSNFRRDRLMYDPWTVAIGKFNRYLGNIPNVYQQWLYNTYYYQRYYRYSPEELDRYLGFGDPMYQNYWTMAVMDSTNLLMRQLTVPATGYHGKNANGTWSYVGNGDPQNRRLNTAAETALKAELLKPQNGGYSDIAYVPRGPGRSMFSVYDSFGFDNYSRINEAGHFWDVYVSMLALTQAETNFLGVDRGSDALKYSLPYYLVFNEQLAPLFSAYWTGTADYYAPSIGKNLDGTATVVLPTFVRTQQFFGGFEYPVDAPTPVDGGGNPMTMAKAYPQVPWSNRFYAEVFSMAAFTANYNQEYANFNQIFRLGSGDNLSPIAGFQTIKFDDPFGGGYSYAALKKTGAVNFAANVLMIDTANADTVKWNQAKADPSGMIDGITAAGWAGKVHEDVVRLEMMRGLFAIFGSGTN